MRRFVKQELPKRLALRGAAGAKSEVDREELLRFRHCLTSPGVLFNGRGLNRDFTSDKGKQVVEELEGWRMGKVACKMQEAHLISQAQAMMRPPTSRDSGTILRTNHHALGHEFSGLTNRIEHRRVLLVTANHGPGSTSLPGTRTNRQVGTGSVWKTKSFFSV